MAMTMTMEQRLLWGVEQIQSIHQHRPTTK